MATNGNESVVPDPQMVGKHFVNLYYTMLHKHPSEAFRFYKDSSVVGRPGPDRQMKSATNIKDINELILAFDMRRYKVEISFADAQSSYENGVVVLVIGSLIGKDNVRINFTQSFFLAPQKIGDFYVLNDVFRFVDDEADKVDETSKADNVVDQASTPPESSVEPDPEQKAQPAVNQTSSSWADSTENEEELGQLSESGKTSVSETKIADVNHQNEKPSNAITKTEAAALSIQLDTPNKSYASVIVNGSTKTASVSVIRSESSRPTAAPQSSTPTASASQQPSRPTVVPQPSKPTAQLQPQVHAPVGIKHASSTSNVSEKNDDHAGKNINTSIFVGNLPFDATEELLRATFVNFGPIKPTGIQIRSSQMNPTCYGFVEFESPGAVKSALEVSPISIGNRRVNIEEKQSTNGARRFSRDDSYYRNDNFRGLGNFSGGGRNGGREASTVQGRSRGGGQNGDGRV